MAPDLRTSRIASVDFIRLVAIFAIILIHSEPFRIYPDGLEHYFYLLYMEASRFAVPCFFFLAGYFWARKLADGVPLGLAFRQYGGRLLTIFVFWCVVYLAIPDPHLFQDHPPAKVLEMPLTELQAYLERPTQLLLEGTEKHLWFLPALICALALSYVSLQLEAEAGVILLLAAVLYVFGLLVGPYTATPVGITFPVNPRNGPFFATLPFILGWYFFRSQRRVSLSMALFMTLGGFALHLIESFLLWQLYGVPPAQSDYLVGTLPYGVGVALLAFSRPSFGANLGFTRFGRYALGLYAVHYFFVDDLPMPDELFFSDLGQVIFPLTVFALALLTVILLSMLPGIKRFVS